MTCACAATCAHIAATLTPSAVNAVAKNPTDNNVLACVMEGQTDYMVASDDHLLKLER